MAIIQPQKSSDVQLQVPVFQPAPTQMNTMPYPVQFTGTALSNGIDGVLKGLQAGFQLRHQLADMSNETKRAQLAGRYIDEANQAMDDYHQGKYDPLMAGLRSDASGATGMDFSRVPDMPMRQNQLDLAQAGLAAQRVANVGSVADLYNKDLELQARRYQTGMLPYVMQPGMDRLSGNKPPALAPATNFGAVGANVLGFNADAASKKQGVNPTPESPSTAGGSPTTGDSSSPNAGDASPQALPDVPSHLGPYDAKKAVVPFFHKFYGSDAKDAIYDWKNGVYQIVKKDDSTVSLDPQIMRDAQAKGAWTPPPDSVNQTAAANPPPDASAPPSPQDVQGYSDSAATATAGSNPNAGTTPSPVNAPSTLVPANRGPAPIQAPTWPPKGPAMPQQDQGSANQGHPTLAQVMQTAPASDQDRIPYVNNQGREVPNMYLDPRGIRYWLGPSEDPYSEQHIYDDPNKFGGVVNVKVYKPNAESLKRVNQIIDENHLWAQDDRGNIIPSESMSPPQKSAALMGFANLQHTKQMTPEQNAGVTNQIQLLQVGQQIKNLASDMGPGQFNAFSQAWNKYKEVSPSFLESLVGQNDPKLTALSQSYQRFQDLLANEVTGKRLNENGIKRITTEMGNLSNKTFPQRFDAELDDLRNRFVQGVGGLVTQRYVVDPQVLKLANVNQAYLYGKGKTMSQMTDQIAKEAQEDAKNPNQNPQGVFGGSPNQTATTPTGPSAQPVATGATAAPVATQPQVTANGKPIPPGYHYVTSLDQAQALPSKSLIITADGTMYKKP